MKTTFELAAHLASARPKPNSRLRAHEDTGVAQLGAAHVCQRPTGKQTRARAAICKRVLGFSSNDNAVHSTIPSSH